MAEDNRRQTDIALESIRISIVKIEGHIESSAKAQVQTWKNKDDIAALCIKQKIITWVGGALILGWISTSFRWVSKHF